MQGVEQYIWDATICVQNNGGGYNIGLLTLRKVIVGRVHKGGTSPRGTQILHRREH